MSTSDQDGQHQLTRKQLREIRLTGSTPVISEEEAAAASQPTPVLPRAAEPLEIAPVPDIEEAEPDAPLTRRHIRALEHVRADRADSDEQPADAPDSEEQAVEDAVAEKPVAEAPSETVAPETVAPTAEEPAVEEPAVEEQAAEEPVVETAPVTAETPQIAELVSEVPVFEPRRAAESVSRFDDSESSPLPAAPEPVEDESDEPEVITAERPMVGAAFGLGVKADKPFGSQFDDLLDGGSSGSQHAASTALIFTPSIGAGSLSGPIASTGELLITGTYALADGIGSQGHAHGKADGRDADAVLLDGELAPASSPTPIAASSAVSTSKSAGEVIRPPVPDKGNKLMLTLAIVAGGLALALAATLIIAATTGVFG
jgi:hypothetical protein